MALIDFTLSNARRFYSSMGNPLGLKGLKAFSRVFMFVKFEKLTDLDLLSIEEAPNMCRAVFK